MFDPRGALPRAYCCCLIALRARGMSLSWALFQAYAHRPSSASQCSVSLEGGVEKRRRGRERKMQKANCRSFRCVTTDSMGVRWEGMRIQAGRHTHSALRLFPRLAPRVRLPALPTLLRAMQAHYCRTCRLPAPWGASSVISRPSTSAPLRAPQVTPPPLLRRHVPCLHSSAPLALLGGRAVSWTDRGTATCCTRSAGALESGQARWRG